MYITQLLVIMNFQRKKAAELLEAGKKEIRMKLASKVNDIRKIPDLIFKFDDALAYGNHINQLLTDINKEKISKQGYFRI